MDEISWEDVILRALGAGVTMGALVGGLLATALAVGPPSHSPLSNILMLVLLGGAIGALIGVGCAIPTGLILAAGRHFLARHLRFAQVYGGLVGGVLLALLYVVGYGLTMSGGPSGPSGPESEGWFITTAFGVGLAVSGFNTRFVVTGRQCLAARYVGRCLNRCTGRRPKNIAD